MGAHRRVTPNRLFALCLAGTVLAAMPNGLEAQSDSYGAAPESKSRSWVSITGSGGLHLAGDQANLFGSVDASEVAATVSTGYRLEGEAGRMWGRARIALQGAWGHHRHQDAPGDFMVTGNTHLGKATLALGLGSGRLGSDLGVGVVYLRSRNVASPAGEVIGLPGVAAGVLVSEWAPMASGSVRIRIWGDDMGRSLALRAGVDVAGTENKVTVLAPIGLQLRWAR